MREAQTALAGFLLVAACSNSPVHPAADIGVGRNPTESPCVVSPANYVGVDLTGQTIAALNDLYAVCPNGGVVDARSFTGSQTLGGITVGQPEPTGAALALAKPVTLLLGPATITVNDTITLFKGSAIVGSVDQSNNPTTILMAGDARALWAVVAVGADWATTPNASGTSCSLRDLIVDGNRSHLGTNRDGNAATVLVTGPSTNVSLINVWVQNSASHGIVSRGVDQTNPSQNNVFYQVRSTGNALAGLTLSFAADHFIYDSEFSVNESQGIRAVDSGGVHLQQSKLSNNWDAGIYTRGTSSGNNIVVGNVFSDNGSAGVHLEDGWGTSVVATNTLTGGSADPTHSRSAIELVSTRKNVIVANLINSPPDGGGRYSWKNGFELSASRNTNLVQSASAERLGTVYAGWYSGTLAVDWWSDNAAVILPPSIVPSLRTPTQPPLPGGDPSDGVDASLQPGSDAGEKISYAIQAVYQKGCTSCWIDARNLTGDQIINQSLTIGNGTHAITLFLGHANYKTNSTIWLPAGSSIVGLPTGNIVNWDFPNSTIQASAGSDLWSIIARQEGAGGGVWDLRVNAEHLVSDPSAAAIVVHNATNVVISDTSILPSNGSGILERTDSACGSGFSGNQIARTMVLDTAKSGLRAENIHGLQVTQSLFNRALVAEVSAISSPNLILTNSDLSSFGALSGYGVGIETSGNACPPNWGVYSFGNLLTNRGAHVSVTSSYANHYFVANGLMGGMLDPSRKAAELNYGFGQFVANVIHDQDDQMTVGWQTWGSYSPFWWITANLVGSRTLGNVAGWLAPGDVAAPDNLYVPSAP